MNLIWHIIKKDLRALKWPLLLWLGFIVAKLGVGVTLLTADGTESPEWFTRMDGLGKVLAAFECVSFVLAAALVQEDLLVGTKSFWVTRPISGARLMSAKLLTLFLVFGAMPLLLTLPWWLGCGYGLREIGWAALETSAIHAACVLIGILWAVVTDGFGRFLMWTLVTLFAIPTLTTTVAYYFTSGLSNAMLSTRFAVGAGIAVIGILVVVVHQYLTRRTLRSIGIIGATGAVLVLVGAFLPWRWNLESQLYTHLMEQEVGQWSAAAEPTGLKFAVESVQLTKVRREARNSQLLVKFRVEGLTESQALRVYWSDYEWRWADGTTNKGGASGRSGLGHMVSEKALGVAMKLAAEGQYTDTVAMTVGLEAERATRLTAEPPALLLSNRLQLLRFDSAVPVPLQGADWSSMGLVGERVASAEKSGEELLVTFIRHYPSLWVNNFAGGYLYEYGGGGFSQYLLVNRAQGFVDRGRAVDRRSTRIGTVEIHWYTQSYHASKKAGGPRPVLEAINALNDAELMRVTYVEQAQFIHEIKIDPLVAEPPVNP